MAYKYLYIDDVQGTSTDSTAKSLSATGDIMVTPAPPKGNWENEIIDLEKEIANFDGLLLDLRLDEKPNAEKLNSKYSGTSVAQEIRTLIKNPEKTVRDIPIVLISSQKNLDDFLDSTGKDLFDYFIKREELTIDEYPIVIKRLAAIAKGYEGLREKPQISGVLGLDNLEFLDPRLTDVMSEKCSQSIHLFAGFLLKSFIIKGGPLIKESVLAARLGIDIAKSGDSWKVVLQSLEEAKYKGTFSEGWNRWWMSGVLKFWKETIQFKNTPRDLTAERRVELIAEKLNIQGLISIEKSKYCKSESYWTTCYATNVALDTSDGFMISNSEGNYPWQDLMYISPLEAKTQLNKKKWRRISASETFRLNALQLIQD